MPTGVILTAVFAARYANPPFPVYLQFNGTLGDDGTGILKYTDNTTGRKASISLTLWTP
jgi:hypothetical protein